MLFAAIKQCIMQIVYGLLCNTIEVINEIVYEWNKYAKESQAI